MREGACGGWEKRVDGSSKCVNSPSYLCAIQLRDGVCTGGPRYVSGFASHCAQFTSLSRCTWRWVALSALYSLLYGEALQPGHHTLAANPTCFRAMRSYPPQRGATQRRPFMRMRVLCARICLRAPATRAAGLSARAFLMAPCRPLPMSIRWCDITAVQPLPWAAAACSPGRWHQRAHGQARPQRPAPPAGPQAAAESYRRLPSSFRLK